MLCAKAIKEAKFVELSSTSAFLGQLTVLLSKDLQRKTF